jgi:MATE family multidrug resistance protein
MVTEVMTPVPARARGAAGGVREVATLAAPIVLTQLSQTIMHVVDSAFVGRLGAAELGAMGFAGIWLWTVFCVFNGCATGVQTFVSQMHGAGDEAGCGHWVWQALYAVVLPATAAITLFALLVDPFLDLVGANAEIHSHAAAFVRTRPLGFAALTVWLVLASFFRGLGDTRTPLVATVIANASNALLAWALVFGKLGLPALGIVGAGIATSIAEWIGAAVLVAALLRARTRLRYGTQPIAPSRPEIVRFLRTGAPIGGQWLLDMSAFAIFTTLVASMGTASIAANQAMLSLLSLSFMQAIGVALAAATLVGRYKGAGDLRAAERSLASALKLGLGVSAIVAALFVGLPHHLLAIYTRDADVLALGRPLLALGAAFQVCDAVGIVVSGALRGAGDTRWPFLVQTSLAWLVRLPLAYGFAVLLGGGVVGAWCGEFVFVSILSGVLWWRFRAGAWRDVVI